MNLIAKVIFISILLVDPAFAQSMITITIDTKNRGPLIPADFSGLSFGTKSLLPGRDGGHFFSPTNAPLITLFQNLGITHLRLGGTTVEAPPTTPIPNHADIDNLFAFARMAGVQKIIYSLRLLETNSILHYAATNAAIAKYIWDHYQSQLDCFALGNEPDLKRVFHQDAVITNFASYLAKWATFAAAISDDVPKAKFAGPDGSSGNVYWTTNFAAAGKKSGLIKLISEHFYVGGAGREVSPMEGIAAMLSPRWIAANQKLFDQMAVPVLEDGLSFEFGEANDHYSGGVRDASDTFAGALWALDFLHWWAAHGASSVNFHNTQWVVNDVITLDPRGGLMTNPKGYGVKAFDLGGHGYVESVSISNPEKINLTAYAVCNSKWHFVTLINKEYGSKARPLKVIIVASGIPKDGTVIYLTAPNCDVMAKTGMTLGGAPITANSPWDGKWTSLNSDKPGQLIVDLPVASAAIVRISTQ